MSLNKGDTGEAQLEHNNIDHAVKSKRGRCMAFCKKWWWALLIVFAICVLIIVLPL